ncbi:MAG: hypothetical protein D6715_09720 [Calditrichaeota bacterium]|nr:MAG: hypothetical protein D6715_09720 [Calditrichota bacterium]
MWRIVLLAVMVLFQAAFSMPTSKTQPSDSTDSALSVDSLLARIKRLEAKVHQLELARQREALEKLKQKARAGLSKPKTANRLPERKFVQGSRTLTAFNPEISLVGDQFFVFNRRKGATDTRTDLQRGFVFRTFEVNFRSNLDPFSQGRATLEINEDGIELSEVYAVWSNLLPHINLAAGRFRQRFGVVNRWHEDALDQIFYPLVLTEFFGEDGLAQLGVSVDWLIPSRGRLASELTVQVAAPQNDAMFSGTPFGLPTVLTHWKNFFDLGAASYFEVGFTGMAGANDQRGFTLSGDHRWSRLGGVDFTYSWTPPGRGNYRGLTWRNEFYFAAKDTTFQETAHAWGGYSYLDYRLNRRWYAGVRLDVVSPLDRPQKSAYMWQTTPYLTYWQSEFVFLRMEFQHLEGHKLSALDNRFLLQLNWVVGPHRHEKY